MRARLMSVRTRVLDGPPAWLYVGDRMQDEHTAFFYSVFDSTQAGY